MAILAKPEEIKTLSSAGAILSEVLGITAKAVRVGISTLELDSIAREGIESRDAKPSFLGYRGFPATLCTSVNEEVVHGIPSNRKLKEGDIIGLDLGLWYGGLAVDAAVTVGVGKISQEDRRLIEITRKSLARGIKAAQVGRYTGDIGAAIQGLVEPKGYGIVRDLVGHGVGRQVHEPPQVPNYGKPGTGDKLVEGLVIAIEPMVTTGTWEVKILEDQWTVVTLDRGRAAHWEQTILLTDKGPKIITPIPR